MPYTFSTYRLAELARHKLLSAAAMPDHDYRLLVLHANLLDNLLEELNMQDLDQKSEPESEVEVEAVIRRRRGKARDEGRDGLAEVVGHHALLHGASEPIVFLEAGGEDAADGEEGEGEVLPMLTHDSSEDEDDGSDFSTDEDEHEEDGVVLASSLTAPSLVHGNDGLQAKRAWYGRRKEGRIVVDEDEE